MKENYACLTYCCKYVHICGGISLFCREQKQTVGRWQAAKSDIPPHMCTAVTSLRERFFGSAESRGGKFSESTEEPHTPTNTWAALHTTNTSQSPTLLHTTVGGGNCSG